MPRLLDCLPEQKWKEAGERDGISPTPTPSRGAGPQQSIPDAGLWGPTVEKLVAFQHLGDNWDGQGAVAPSYEQLESAIGLAYTLYQQGVDPPSRVVPGPEG